MTSATDIIRLLSLTPHPEGGHYRETFRDTRTIDGARAVSTAIYYMLAEGERSHWHRVDAAEGWFWHAGSPLALSVAIEGKKQVVTLGPGIAAGEQPHFILPAHAWQAARSLGAWSLVSCTVAPGFEFSGFEMAPKGWEP